jgi:putative hemolysin
MLSITTELAILALLVIANGLLSAAETAIVSSKKVQLRKRAKSGRIGAIRALDLAEHPTRFLALVQFWLTLSGLIAGVLAGAGIADQVIQVASHKPWAGPWVQPASYAVVIFCVTAFMLIFGELVPKRIALAQPERTAELLASSMKIMAWFAAPVLGIIGRLTDGLIALIRILRKSLATTKCARWSKWDFTPAFSNAPRKRWSKASSP